MASILNTYPQADATDVPINAILQVAFTTAMDPATISDLTIILSYGNYDIAEVVVTYNISQKLAYIEPKNFLLPDTHYKLILIGDYGGVGAGVKDAGGIGLADNYIVEFDTAPTLPDLSGLYVVNGEYWIDATGEYGTGTAVLPVDGAFDSGIEEFYVQIAATGLALGAHNVYVHGKDSKSVWGTIQSLELNVTASGPTGTANATSYNANLQGPFAYDLQLHPSPTDGAPEVAFTGKFTTNTAYQAEVSGVVPTKVGNLAVVSLDPEDYESLCPLDKVISITFNDVVDA